MQSPIRSSNLRLGLLTAAIFLAQSASAAPWIYRGSLSDGGSAAEGQYDLRLSLLDNNGRLLAAPITLNAVSVSKGRFATEVDFGVDPDQLTSAQLQTEVQQQGSGFVSLGAAKAVTANGFVQTGVCWDTGGNSASASAVIGTTDTASNSILTITAQGSSFLQLRGTGGVEQNQSSALGFSSTAWNQSSASGANSFTAGFGVTTVNAPRSFVFSDDQSQTFAASSPGQFLVRASGSVAFNTSVPDIFSDFAVGARPGGVDPNADLVLRSLNDKQVVLSAIDTNGALNIFGTPSGANYLSTQANGASLSAGGTWTNGSSRRFKQDFTTVNALSILNKVVALPISTWTYKQSSEGLHIGPMAEDFKAAFAVGSDAEHISTVDADGIALAAIQGLNAKLETENSALKQRLQSLEAADAENSAMKARLDAIEAQLAR